MAGSAGAGLLGATSTAGGVAATTGGVGTTAGAVFEGAGLLAGAAAGAAATATVSGLPAIRLRTSDNLVCAVELRPSS